MHYCGVLIMHIETIYRNCHARELAIVQMGEPKLQQFTPQMYHSISSIKEVSYLDHHYYHRVY